MLMCQAPTLPAASPPAVDLWSATWPTPHQEYDPPPPPPPPPCLQPGTQVVVHGLPYSYTWQQLKDLGKTAASVLHADIVSNPDGSSKGWGILAFATPSDAQAAIQVC